MKGRSVAPKRQREQEETQNKVLKRAVAEQEGEIEPESVAHAQSWSNSYSQTTQALYSEPVVQEAVSLISDISVLQETTQQALDCTAAYTLEREGKSVKASLQALSHSETLSAFLHCIVYGEQSQAEAILCKESNLVLQKSDVQDPSGRAFKAITAFQYTLWALDWRSRCSCSSIYRRTQRFCN